MEPRARSLLPGLTGDGGLPAGHGCGPGGDRPLQGEHAAWFTECGWQTSPVRREPWLSGVSESVQADYTRRLLAYVRAHTELKVDAVIAYNDKDLSSKPTGNKFDQSGLRRYNGKTKPAAAALA